jgi:hypothetical protein
VCDCQLTLYGITCLGPAGNFNFTAAATETERLEKGTGNIDKVAELPQSQNDWPTLRADNTASATTNATIPDKCELLPEVHPYLQRRLPQAAWFLLAVLMELCGRWMQRPVGFGGRHIPAVQFELHRLYGKAGLL